MFNKDPTDINPIKSMGDSRNVRTKIRTQNFFNSDSPYKEGGFIMDPMLEAALDFDTDDEDHQENGD